MTSAKSCKNPERTWTIEILRRCKALPALIAVAYFLNNILPIIFSYNKFENCMSYVYGVMTGANFLNNVISIAGGIVVSCAVFKYLHNTASVIDTHAKPLTRTQFFRGSFFAGLMMVAAPVVLTGILFLFMMGAHCEVGHAEIIDTWGISYDPEKIICVSNIAGWTLDNILLIGFAYCISCLAAILAGTVVVQALLSLVLMFLPLVIYFFFEEYMSSFLFGFGGEFEMMKYLSPYVCMLIRDGYPFSGGVLTLIAFAAAAALIAFAAACIYRKIKLENEENTIVVPYVAEILVIILTALAASTTLFIATTFMELNSPVSIIVTLILATIVFFPAFCMIAEQSFRVFKRKNLKVLAVYAAAMCIVLAFTVFDVTGYESRVPETSEIASISMHDNNLINPDCNNIKDEETIAKITALHKALAGTEDEVVDINYGVEESEYLSGGKIDIRYKLKSGGTVLRSYDQITESAFKAYAAYYDDKKIREHECFDLDEPLKKGQYLTVMDIHVNDDGSYSNDDSYRVPSANEKGIMEAANKDIMKWTAENRRIFYNGEYNPWNDDGTYSLSINYDGKNRDLEEEYDYYTRYYEFKDMDTNFNQYIKDHPEIMTRENDMDR